MYKKKIGVDGKVQTFKARLIAKGFSKKRDWLRGDLSPVDIFKIIRILLSTASHYIMKFYKCMLRWLFLIEVLMSASIWQN